MIPNLTTNNLDNDASAFIFTHRDSVETGENLN